MFYSVTFFLIWSTETLASSPPCPSQLIQLYVKLINSHNSVAFNHQFSVIFPDLGPAVYFRALSNVAEAKEARFVELGLSGSIKYHLTLMKMHLFVCFNAHRGPLYPISS